MKARSVKGKIIYSGYSEGDNRTVSKSEHSVLCLDKTDNIDYDTFNEYYFYKESTEEERHFLCDIFRITNDLCGSVKEVLTPLADLIPIEDYDIHWLKFDRLKFALDFIEMDYDLDIFEEFCDRLGIDTEEALATRNWGLNCRGDLKCYDFGNPLLIGCANINYYRVLKSKQFKSKYRKFKLSELNI